MIEKFINQIHDWAMKEESIESIILVGAYAKGTHHATSDVDLCIITTNKLRWLNEQSFIEQFGRIEKKQTEADGLCTSIGVWYQSGQEVEFGFVEPTWISTPLDTGTLRVLQDGYKVIIDKKDYFTNLSLA